MEAQLKKFIIPALKLADESSPEPSYSKFKLSYLEIYHCDRIFTSLPRLQISEIVKERTIWNGKLVITVIIKIPYNLTVKSVKNTITKSMRSSSHKEADNFYMIVKGEEDVKQQPKR